MTLSLMHVCLVTIFSDESYALSHPRTDAAVEGEKEHQPVDMAIGLFLTKPLLFSWPSHFLHLNFFSNKDGIG
jgi:hypothetical protein